MNLHERLMAAYLAAREGRHEDALNEYIWFHENALEIDPAFRGVRLSFALTYWLELGSQYPKAMDALTTIRDRKSQLLSEGVQDRDMFQDVVALNEALDRTSETHLLFKNLAVLHPEFATACARLAVPAILKAGDFQLARGFLVDPQATVERLSSGLNEDIEMANAEESANTSKAMFNAFVTNYAEDVAQVLTVLSETDDKEMAAALREKAIQSVCDMSAREALCALLNTIP